MTSIKISYVDPTGYESFWNTLNSAFGDHAPLLDALYPQRGTARGDQSAIKRLQKRSTDDDNDLYCIEASIENKPAGAAIWSVRRTPPTGDLVKDEYVDRESGLWDKESHAFAQGLWEVYVEGRIKTINETKSEGKSTWILEWLAVLPSARKKGVGEALVAWGRDKADENGENSITESTVAAFSLYQRCGYEVVEEIDFGTVGRKFPGRKLPNLTSMRRKR